MEFCWSVWRIRDISAVVGTTVLFDKELCVGGAVGARHVGIDEANDGNLGGFVFWSRTEIVFEMACSG